jgi:hypothetical protein
LDSSLWHRYQQDRNRDLWIDSSHPRSPASSAFSTTCPPVSKQSTWRQVAASCTVLRSVSDSPGEDETAGRAHTKLSTFQKQGVRGRRRDVLNRIRQSMETLSWLPALLWLRDRRLGWLRGGATFRRQQPLPPWNSVSRWCSNDLVTITVSGGRSPSAHEAISHPMYGSRDNSCQRRAYPRCAAGRRAS